MIMFVRLIFNCCQGLEWRLTEKDTEIAAARERLELIEQRQMMEMNNITQSLQVIEALIFDEDYHLLRTPCGLQPPVPLWLPG